MRSFSVSAFVITVAGCASVTGPHTQWVAVHVVQDGKPLTAVLCTLSNSEGKWELTAPGSVQVNKSASPLMVECRRQASSGREVLTSKHNAAVFGNLLVGGGLGYFFDAKSGAGFDYPENVIVIMQSTVPDPIRPRAWTRFPPLVETPPDNRRPPAVPAP